MTIRVIAANDSRAWLAFDAMAIVVNLRRDHGLVASCSEPCRAQTNIFKALWGPKQ